MQLTTYSYRLLGIQYIFWRNLVPRYRYANDLRKSDMVAVESQVLTECLAVRGGITYRVGRENGSSVAVYDYGNRAMDLK